MKLILRHDVDNLGTAGEIVDVADGYGNNYLVPRGLAMKATKGAVADAEAISRSRAKQEARSVADAEAQRDALQARAVSVPAKAGDDGTLYGSVGNAIIADAIKGQLGVTVDRRKLDLGKPIKTTGTHTVELTLHAGVTATVTVEVVGST